MGECNRFSSVISLARLLLLPLLTVPALAWSANSKGIASNTTCSIYNVRTIEALNTWNTSKDKDQNRLSMILTDMAIVTEECHMTVSYCYCASLNIGECKEFSNTLQVIRGEPSCVSSAPTE